MAKEVRAFKDLEKNFDPPLLLSLPCFPSFSLSRSLACRKQRKDSMHMNAEPGKREDIGGTKTHKNMEKCAISHRHMQYSVWYAFVSVHPIKEVTCKAKTKTPVEHREFGVEIQQRYQVRRLYPPYPC